MADGQIVRAAKMVVEGVPTEQALRAIAHAIDKLNEHRVSVESQLVNLTQRLSRLEQRPGGQKFEEVRL